MIVVTPRTARSPVSNTWSIRCRGRGWEWGWGEREKKHLTFVPLFILNFHSFPGKTRSGADATNHHNEFAISIFGVYKIYTLMIVATRSEVGEGIELYEGSCTAGTDTRQRPTKSRAKTIIYMCALPLRESPSPTIRHRWVCTTASILCNMFRIWNFK